jgi:hypothetical protein
VFAVAGAVLAAVGLTQSFGEITPYFAAGIGMQQRFGAVVAGGYQPGDSLWSKDLFLADCLDVPRGIYALAQPPARHLEFAGKCRVVSSMVVAAMPTYSTAWLVFASSSLALDDPAGFRSGLLESSRTGANVHWLAERRSALAAAHLDLLDDAGRAAYRRDLEALTGSSVGLEVLAGRYVSDAAQREIITEVVETAPAARQRAFVGRVRKLSSGSPQ